MNGQRTIDGQGGNGPFATYVINPSNGYVRFESVSNPGLFIALVGGVVTSGTGGPNCGAANADD